MSTYDKPPIDETTTGRGSGSRSSPTRRDRVDPVSLVAGTLLVAVALAVLVERYWVDVDVDTVTVAGGAVAAAGAAIIVATVLRFLRRDG